MGPSLKELISIGGPPILSRQDSITADIRVNSEVIGSQLIELLGTKNGFLAFESALHVFPIGKTISSQSGYDLLSWNSLDLWIDHYNELAKDLFFFAEDIFGCQFAIKADRIFKFDPETADATEVASDFEGWASVILADYKVETGWPLAHEWQRHHGPLLVNQRLVPKVPFVAGGKFDIENLYVTDAVEGMRFRGSLAQQIHNLPDGANIKFVIS